MIDQIIDRRIELWKQISATTIFSRAKRADEMIRAGWTIDEVNMISESKCANMLRNILNDNSFTTYMS